MKTPKWERILLLGTMLCIGIAPAPGLASSMLGSAQDFAVLGHSTVTNTGSSTIYGSLGVIQAPRSRDFLWGPWPGDRYTDPVGCRIRLRLIPSLRTIRWQVCRLLST